MRNSTWLAVLVLGATLTSGGLQAAGVAAQSADEIVETIRTQAVAYGINPDYLVRVARCEAGPGLNRFAVGSAGEQGIFQLHPQGERRTFFAYGFTDVWSVEQQATFTARRFAEGGARAWSCR